MVQPETRFALAGDINIAYQIIGDGPVDLVWAWGLASNIEVWWEEPSYAAFLTRLGEFCRVILFDRRGCGASDRGVGTATPTLEDRVADVLAVLDAAGVERASIFGVSEGGNLAALFAATHPERTTKIILYGTLARYLKDAEHPWGWREIDEICAFIEHLRLGWGTTGGAALSVQLWAPTMASDRRFIGWLAKHSRQSVSRSLIVPLQWSLLNYDGFDVFPAVRVPTLILHRRDDALVPVEQSRFIARQVPDARLIELGGSDHLPFLGDSEEVLTNVEAFLVGAPGAAANRRRLLTIVVVDITGSTAVLSGLRDDARRQLVANHEDIVKSHFLRFEGEWFKQLSDAALAAFDGPARAVRCALGIREATERLGLALRIGVHTGECELDDGDVYGIALNLATQIAKLAAPGEILVSSTVRDLVSGSGLRFADAREIEIEGMEHRVVFPVLVRGVGADAARRLAVEQANLLRRDGEYWTLAYDGQVAAARDTKGVRDLARLLASPHQELHVLDLAAEAQTPAMQQWTATTPGDVHTGELETEPILDDTARSQYKQRIRELEQDIDDAEARGDSEACENARRELDAIVENLSAAYGLGGRLRRVPGRIERARKAVTRRVRDAIGRIARVHPSLGRHLDTSIRTGVFCCYAPERNVLWTIEEK